MFMQCFEFIYSFYAKANACFQWLKSLLSKHNIGMIERVTFFSAANKTKLAGEEKIGLKRNLLVERSKIRFN